MSLDYFLFTYSVENVGHSTLSETRTNRVRDQIASLKNREDLEKYDARLSEAFSRWEKIENIETTFKGWISIDGESHEQKQKDAIRKFSNLLQSILKENAATSSNTAIHCAVMTETLGDTFEFHVVGEKFTLV